jgi:hypothetical protein
VFCRDELEYEGESLTKVVKDICEFASSRPELGADPSALYDAYMLMVERQLEASRNSSAKPTTKEIAGGRSVQCFPWFVLGLAVMSVMIYFSRQGGVLN